MAAEIVAAVQICASAYRFMKTAVNEGRELGDMTRALSKFWDAREEVSVLEQQATNPSKIQQLFGGKSIESQALGAGAGKHYGFLLGTGATGGASPPVAGGQR